MIRTETESRVELAGHLKQYGFNMPMLEEHEEEQSN